MIPQKTVRTTSVHSVNTCTAPAKSMSTYLAWLHRMTAFARWNFVRFVILLVVITRPFHHSFSPMSLCVWGTMCGKGIISHLSSHFALFTYSSRAIRSWRQLKSLLTTATFKTFFTIYKKLIRFYLRKSTYHYIVAVFNHQLDWNSCMKEFKFKRQGRTFRSLWMLITSDNHTFRPTDRSVFKITNTKGQKLMWGTKLYDRIRNIY